MTQIAPARTRSRVKADTMLAATIVGPGNVELRTLPLPAPGPGQVRIQIESCGICGSNIPVWEGREWFNYPLHPGNPGHEPCGTIDALGDDVKHLKIGQRVAALSYSAFATHDIADASSVLPLPPSPDLLSGNPFPGEALGCAMNVFRRSGINRGDVVAIVGIGFLGALLTELAAESGARVIAISRREFALDVARRNGAGVTIPMTGGDDRTRIIDAVKRSTGDKLCDVVIEAVGHQWPLDLASEITRERGRLIIAGYHQDGPRHVNMQMWNWRGLDVINAHERDPQKYVEGMKLAAEAIASGRLDPSHLYTHRVPIENLAVALDTARDRPEGFLKAIVTMGDHQP